jgi:Domain of unknown function (DUF4157)
MKMSSFSWLQWLRSRSDAPHTLRAEKDARWETSKAGAPRAVEQTLASPGRPLDPRTRAFMETRLGHDFSRVRVHDDAKAADSAASLDALAYATGQDLVFGRGQHAPATAGGQHLLAHELAHVVQQDRAASQGPQMLSRPGDAGEVSAERTAGAAVEGLAMPTLSGGGAAIQRQTGAGLGLGLGPGPGLGSGLGLGGPIASTQTQGEIVVQSFLRRMWDVQSKQEQPFRVTPKVLEGIKALIPLGVSTAINTYPTADAFYDVIRSRIPATVDENAIRYLDSLPKSETSLTKKEKGKGEAAKPEFPTPSPLEAGKPPEKAKGTDEALKKALEAAVEEFCKTELGKQLESSVKQFVLSKEGIPFDALVVAGVVTFVAKNDPKLPSVPEIPLGEGIKLKFEYEGRLSDLPPLLRQMVGIQGQRQPGKEETKIGVSVEFTFDDISKFVVAVGKFFAKVAEGIGKGIVKIGTVIGKAIKSIADILVPTLVGAGIGALIGGLAGGGLGAGIGALIGAGVGLIAGLIKHFS